MRLKTLLFFYSLCSIFCQAQSYKPVFTEKGQQTDTFFGHAVADPYRWLEETQTDRVQNWVDLQNKASQKYLSAAGRGSLAFDPIRRYGYVVYKHPRKMGKYYFTYYYDNKTNAPALYYQTSLNSPSEKIIEPRNISLTDNIRIDDYALSPDAQLLAYAFSRNGSDYKEIRIVSMKHGENLEDHLTGIKFSSIAWFGNGFFYEKINQEGQFGTIENSAVFYHKVGSLQSEDELIFGSKKKNLGTSLSFFTTSGRNFILTEDLESKGIMNIYYREDTSGILTPLLSNLKTTVNVIGYNNGRIIAITEKEAANGRLISFDKKNPLEWETIIPELEDAVLEEAHLFRDRIVTVYRTSDHPVLIIWDYSGHLLHKLDMPVATSLGGFSGSFDEEQILFGYTSYAIPQIVYSLNIRTFKTELVEKTTVTYDVSDIEQKVVEYTASDGVKVPMTLVYKKGLQLDGNNPALLKAYGGFGVSSGPGFDRGIVYFIKQGGVFALAHIRGGGEKGLQWFKAGRGRNKQRSFDDFIDAAEFLVKEKYTAPDLLAATGSSNGGLVVAVAGIQRPDLFKVVLPVAAPLDMIRFERFTIGVYHKDEYGSVTDSAGFNSLYHYSPYANIRDSINYPSMLIFAADNDDRVAPFHSYKFAARLQSRECQKNPILLKVEHNAGHFGASGWQSGVQFDVDFYNFILNELVKK